MMVDAVPTLEQIRLVSSGTEAVMSALRLARAFTGRHKIIKFDGCYHGHVDSMLVSAGSGLATQNIASSAGVPPEFSVHTISIPFNDREALERIFASQGSEIAAVIIEPVPANMGVVLPENGFLKALRDITRKHKALLIFDEVITGFRLALGGAQAYFNIEADLCCYGKIIGGGFPVGAFAGSKAIMSLIAPVGTVYQAGTLSGNPVAVSAGIATLELLSQSNFHANLNAKSDRFVSQLRSALNSAVTVNAIGSLFTVFFSAQPVNHYADARQSDLFAFLTHYQHLLSQGIYGSPSQFEANFISAAHTDEELNRLVKAIADNVLDKHD